MPHYLVALNIGPVQGFIATARRTRDLWFGSRVLSEISKAAARSLKDAKLKDAKAQLIFPAPDTNLTEDSAASIANRVLAELDTSDPRTVLERARAAAAGRWRALAEQALEKVGKVDGRCIRHPVWAQQIDDIVECTWIWIKCADGEPFHQTHERLKRLEAARKMTRDFVPAALHSTDAPGYGLPKSSLDGARETVLQENLQPSTRRRLGLGTGEQLDCPGLVKRLCGGEKNAGRFTPISRLALDPWLRTIPVAAFEPVRKAYEPLVVRDLATRVTGNDGIYGDLPYDGQLLFPSRIEAALDGQTLKNIADDDKEKADIQRELRSLRDVLKPLWKDYREPCPYVALLMADGDRMGELLDTAQRHAGGSERLRRISACLADFAQQVPGWVREYRGHCVYSGGDDVLALLPLDRVLECARRLHDEFGRVLQQETDNLGLGQSQQPTLSVGIAIEHFLTPLGTIREAARQAESLAKGDGLPHPRDGLGIMVAARSGAPLRFRDQWCNHPDARLREWMQLIDADKLPDKAPYELRDAATRLDWAANEARGELEMAEARRILARKRVAGGSKTLAKEHIDRICRQLAATATPRLSLTGLAEELLIGRWLAQRVSR